MRISQTFAFQISVLLLLLLCVSLSSATLKEYPQRPYVAAFYGPSIESEIRYLRAQIDIFWEKEQTVIGQQLAAIQLQMKAGVVRVLDLGCGPGHLSRKILENFANVSVTCFDIDEELLSFARKQNADFIAENRLEVVNGSAENLLPPLTEGSFQLVVSRLLFQHLLDPMAAAQGIFRVLEADVGRVIIIDADATYEDVFEPQLPALDRLRVTWSKLKTRYLPKGNVLSSRYLFRLLKRVGFVDIDYCMLAEHSDIFAAKQQRKYSEQKPLSELLEPFITIHHPMQYHKALEKGKISRAAFAQIVKQFESLFNNNSRTTTQKRKQKRKRRPISNQYDYDGQPLMMSAVMVFHARKPIESLPSPQSLLSSDDEADTNVKDEL